MKTNTETLVNALRVLADEIESGDGVANPAIREAADRLESHWLAIVGMHAAVCRNKMGAAYRMMLTEIGACR